MPFLTIPIVLLVDCNAVICYFIIKTLIILYLPQAELATCKYRRGADQRVQGSEVWGREGRRPLVPTPPPIGLEYDKLVTSSKFHVVEIDL